MVSKLKFKSLVVLSDSILLKFNFQLSRKNFNSFDVLDSEIQHNGKMTENELYSTISKDTKLII